YTKSQNKGIFIYEFDVKNSALTFVSNTKNINNPSYLTINNDGTKIYSVGERENGVVFSFDFNNKTGKIDSLNKQQIHSSGPCYISLSNDEKHIFVANYGSGTISALPLDADGTIAPLSQSIQHEGNSINKKRQEKPHAHSIISSPDGSHVYAADLGADKIFAYAYSPLSKTPLEEAKQAFIKTKPGSGPRHFIFNRSGNYAYVIGELDASITVYRYNNNELKDIQTVDMNAPDFEGINGAADIHLSHDGKFLYASNRGSANEIVIFKVDTETGKLTRIASQSSLGKAPRNFVIDPTDNYLLVANQDSNNIVVFKRDKETGLLKHTGSTVEVGAPVCLKFTPKQQ
ncbi:lactonase family protein, partial [Pseudoxanthomonas sp. SGD-10]